MRTISRSALLSSVTLALLVVIDEVAGRMETYYDHPLRSIQARDYIDASDTYEAYDYVIAGGGLAGLVLASRLTEQSNVDVLVLEAGKSGDEVKDGINAPAGAYYSSIVNTDYDWKHMTVPQTNLSGRPVQWPRGKILGGSSAMNAMYLVRPSDVEMDAWADIISEQDSEAAKNWNWDSMFEYMKKAENFNRPSEELTPVIDITYDEKNHGSGGPMQLGYPAIMIDIVSNWTSSLEGAGIAELTSPNGGRNIGGFISPSSINPSNWTRSYSRSAYIDSLPPRKNLHIISEATVTRFILSDDAKDSNGHPYATEVEWGPTSEGKDGDRRTVKVRKEVILSGGSLGSPKMLMHSGVGPKDVLENAGVDLKVELPGVGQHLQDHLTAGVVWETPLETAGDIHQSGSDFARTPEFLSFINDAVAFVNASRLFDGNTTEFHTEIKNALNASASSLVPSTSPEVVEGYKAIYSTIVDKFLLEEKCGQVEMLMSVISPGVVSIQSAIQHPYSTGRLYINGSDPFEEVVIDPQYFSHFADVIMMRQGIKAVRAVGLAFGAAFGAEIEPGPFVQTDEQIDAWLINAAASTQYHPACSCAMLPKSKGGVVDANLRVYGLANVRVVDSSVFPFEFAAHLASATYGVAEQAAVLIKNSNQPTVPGAPASRSGAAMGVTAPSLKAVVSLGALVYAAAAFLAL